MSLQVWLPLNGTLENKGLDTVTVTNNGATIDSNGKIGQCYYFNGSSYIKISLPSSLTSIKNTTISAWIKSTSNTVALGGISHDSTSAVAALTYTTSGWEFTGGSYLYMAGGSIANTSVWHHVACVCDDTTATSYLDGSVVVSKKYTDIGTLNFSLGSSNFIEIGCDHPGGDEYLTGYVNDFRIYDNALSEKDILSLYNNNAYIDSNNNIHGEIRA